VRGRLEVDLAGLELPFRGGLVTSRVSAAARPDA